MSDKHEERSVELSLSPEFRQAQTPEIWKERCKVLTYLITWALHSESYRFLTITENRDGELNARYQATKDGPTTFFMVAIPRLDGSYSCHS